MVKLNLVRFNVWRKGEDDTEKKHQKVMEYSNDVLDYLQLYLPSMLRELDCYRKIY